MSECEFKRLYMCEFIPDPAIKALDDKLMQYYKETEDCDNNYARLRWNEFKLWACGYTSQEISHAKRRASGLIK